MGKTLFISRMAEKLKREHNVLITIPVHGPTVTMDSVMECLISHQRNSSCSILHFDISPLVFFNIENQRIIFYIILCLSLRVGNVAGGHNFIFTSYSTELV